MVEQLPYGDVSDGCIADVKDLAHSGVSSQLSLFDELVGQLAGKHLGDGTNFDLRVLVAAQSCESGLAVLEGEGGEVVEAGL